MLSSLKGGKKMLSPATTANVLPDLAFHWWGSISRNTRNSIHLQWWNGSRCQTLSPVETGNRGFKFSFGHDAFLPIDMMLTWIPVTGVSVWRWRVQFEEEGELSKATSWWYGIGNSSAVQDPALELEGGKKRAEHSEKDGVGGLEVGRLQSWDPAWTMEVKMGSRPPCWRAKPACSAHWDINHTNWHRVRFHQITLYRRIMTQLCWRWRMV